MELTGDNESFAKSPIVTFYTFIAPFIVWYFGIKARKDIQKGKLTFKEGVAEGFKISLTYAIISPFIFPIYYQINPAILGYVKEAYQMPDAANSTIILIDMGAQFIAATLFGTIYGAIVTLLLKKK